MKRQHRARIAIMGSCGGVPPPRSSPGLSGRSAHREAGSNGDARALTVRAPAARVWPWIAQLGQARGGFYSYDFLENLAGCNIHSADRIIDQWQDIKAVRDAISMLLGEIAFTVGTGLLLPGGSPLTARQILLVNLFTDLVPSMALAARPPGGITSQALLAEGPDVSLASPLTRDVLIRSALTAGAGTAAWCGGRLTGITSRRQPPSP
jgi:Cation transporting ATPase, C-terminus